MAGAAEHREQPHIDLTLRLDRQLDQIAAQLRELATAKTGCRGC